MDMGIVFVAVLVFIAFSGCTEQQSVKDAANATASVVPCPSPKVPTAMPDELLDDQLDRSIDDLTIVG
ncbi:MAG: hypothetical protein V1835_05505 [Candidatus Micrarchaeota archaeon]